jgi:hypothetical protein
MSPLTTITASCAATTAAALVTLGAVAALGTANAGDTTAPGSHAGVTVVRPAGTMPNGISRTPTEAIPAATAIEYGLIAAVNISVDSPTAARAGPPGTSLLEPLSQGQGMSRFSSTCTCLTQSPSPR